MTLTDIWQTLPPEAQSFLLDLAGKLVEALFKGAASTRRAAVRGAEAKQALRESLTRAVAAFLACLELPEGLQERWDWEAHIQTLLGPIFADPDVQEALLRAVLYEGRPEAVDIAPFRAAWEARYGEGGEATLPWREGQSLETAARAFARAFEEEVRSRPALHTFLLTALLRQVADRLRRGVPVEGMDALIGAVERLTQQQERLIALFIDLARQGYSVSVQGDVTGTLIITGDNNKVIIPDGGRLTALFRRLPKPTRALAEYRAHIRRTCALLPLEGLALPEIHGRPLDPTRLRIPLDRVYIRLRALPYRDRPEGPEDARTLARYLRDRHLEYRQWEERRPTAESQTIPPEEAVDRHHQLVILGPPGAGKSTFLRHLAWAWAETDALPLLVPLGRADVAMAGGRSLLEAALDYLTEHKAGAEREALRAALEAEIREKRVCWLWDGLDEVRVHRREVVEALGRLAADGHRMVITSRPVGYVSIPGCDALYEVLPLLPEDARAFTDRWFRALAEARGVPERERERWAGERAGWLRRQLEERPGLREVARNPLMLTFLAVLAGDEPRRDLPRRRKDLYALYIERLFTAWEERRRPGEEKSLLPGVEDPHAAREVLLWGFRRVALHLHRAYGEQPERAALTEVKDVLAKELGQNAKLDRFQAAARAEAILRFWEEAGLLDVYRLEGREFLAFRHLTFQEYGAARALAEAYPEDPDGLWAELRPHLLDDEWAEVIPLVLAYLDDATPLLDRLLEANAQDEDLQRPLFRAAAALAEGAKAAEETARRVVDRLEHIAKTRQEVWRLVGQANAYDAVKALGRLEGVPYAVERLLALAHQETVNPEVRVQAAEALGRLGRIEEAASTLLTLAQQETVNPWVRVQAAKALGRLGRARELLTLAQQETVNSEVRLQAAKALGRLGRIEEAASILLTLAQQETVDPEVRLQAAKALGRLGRARELLTLAQQETVNPRVRLQAAKALGRLGRARELLTLAQQETVNPRVRLQAAKALGRLGRTEEAASILLTLAQQETVNPWVRVQAAEALDRLGRTEEATSILLTLAQQETVDPWVRVQAAEALDRLGRARELLTLAQQETVNSEVRLQAAKALGRLGRIEEAAPILLTLAQQETVNPWVRVQAAEALDRLGRARELLTLAQQETVNPEVRVQAAEALGRLGRIEEAAPILLTLAQQETVNPEVRVQAAEALGRLGRARELLTLAQQETVDPEVRAQAAEALGRLGRARELLTLAQQETVDPWVRAQAAEALGRLGRARELLTLAQQETVDPWVRVQAAEALGRLGRTEEAAPILLTLAQQETVNPWVRVQAAEALGNLGAATPEILEGLRALTENPSIPEPVRQAAQESLHRLQT